MSGVAETHNPPPTTKFMVTTHLIGYAIWLVPVYWVAFYRRHATLADFGFRRTPILDASLYMGGTLLVLFGAEAVWGRIAQHLGIELQKDMLKEYGPGWHGLILALFFGAFLSPIVEEVFFRGFLFAGLRKSFPFWSAGWASGLIFGAIHLVPGAIVPLAVSGFLWAWLKERTGSIWPPILMHMLNNVIYFSLYFYNDRGTF